MFGFYKIHVGIYRFTKKIAKIVNCIGFLTLIWCLWINESEFYPKPLKWAAEVFIQKLTLTLLLSAYNTDVYQIQTLTTPTYLFTQLQCFFIVKKVLKQNKSSTIENKYYIKQMKTNIVAIASIKKKK